MSIFPLPQFEADVAEADREIYERLKPPTTMVVRFGAMRMVGEFPYDGDAKPGCGSKIVVRTHRGVELGEMLTSTCPNAGCSKSVTRKEMLEYIENSGGAEYPFFDKGKALRVATVEDMNRQAEIEKDAPRIAAIARAHAQRLGLPMKVVDAEQILSLDLVTIYFMAEDRVDFRELVRALSQDLRVRVEMRQIGARDEARLVADYERCGQHCCCKQFLKVLKPVPMRTAKTQKATLDPLKISGRCGRLMCCLRYEDETYETLRKRLPKRGKKVGTPQGNAVVVDTQILTQLVLVELDADRTRVAIPVEEIGEPGETPVESGATRGMSEKAAAKRTDDRRRRTPRSAQQDAHREKSQREDAPPAASGASPEALSDGAGDGAEQGGAKRKRRRRRRRRKGGGGDAGDSNGGTGGPAGDA